MDARLEIHRHAREVVGPLVDGLGHVTLRPQAEPVLAAVTPEEPVSGPAGVRVRAFLHQGVAAGVEVQLRELRIVGRCEFAPVRVERDIDPRPDRPQLSRCQSKNGRRAAPMLQAHLTHADNAHRFLVVDDVRQLADPSQAVIVWRGVPGPGNAWLTRRVRQKRRGWSVGPADDDGRGKAGRFGLRGRRDRNSARRLRRRADLGWGGGFNDRRGIDVFRCGKRCRLRCRFFSSNDRKKLHRTLGGRLRRRCLRSGGWLSMCGQIGKRYS